MSEQLIRFVDMDDPDEVSVATLYLSILPPVGTEVYIRETRFVDDRQEAVTTKWMVDHHYWHIDRRWTALPTGSDQTAHGLRHMLSAFIYLKRL